MWRNPDPFTWRRWECKMRHLLCRTVWQFPPKRNTELPFDPAVLLVGMYLREKNKHTVCLHKNLCMNILNNIVPNSQREDTQMSTSECLGKQNVA